MSSLSREAKLNLGLSSMMEELILALYQPLLYDQINCEFVNWMDLEVKQVKLTYDITTVSTYYYCTCTFCCTQQLRNDSMNGMEHMIKKNFVRCEQSSMRLQTE